jgi:hypothetical protein
MILADLREAYSDVKFGMVLSENSTPAQAESEECNEPEMEVEIIFAEEDEAEAEPTTEVEAAVEPKVEAGAAIVADVAPVTEPTIEPAPETEGEAEVDTETETEEPAEESSISPVVAPLAAVAATAAVAEAAAATAVGVVTSVVEPAAEPIAEAVVEPIAEAVAEPIAEATVAPIAEPVVAEPAVEPAAEPVVEPAAEPVVEPTVAEAPIVDDDLSIVNSQLSINKPHRSAILSLYEEAPTVVGEQFRDNSTSVADMIASSADGMASPAHIASLRCAIGVADKFMLVQDLFGGDDAAYDFAINTLDSMPSFDDCVIFISENYAWSPNSDGAKFMMELLQRKYNA